MIEHLNGFVCLGEDRGSGNVRSSFHYSFVPDCPRFKVSSGRYRDPIFAQNLSNVHHSDGACHDQPEIGFGESFAWTSPSTESPHRVYVLEDFWSGRVHEAVWVEDFGIGVYVFVSCDAPGARIVRLKAIGNRWEKSGGLGKRSPDVVKHRRIPGYRVSLVDIILREAVWDSWRPR